MTLLWNSSISTRTNDRIATVLSLPFINNTSLHPSTDMGGMNEHAHKTQKSSEYTLYFRSLPLLRLDRLTLGMLRVGLSKRKMKNPMIVMSMMASTTYLIGLLYLVISDLFVRLYLSLSLHYSALSLSYYR